MRNIKRVMGPKKENLSGDEFKNGSMENRVGSSMNQADR